VRFSFVLVVYLLLNEPFFCSDDADSLVGNVKMPPRERGNSIQVDSEVPQPVPQSRRRNSSSASYPIY
jgi:hypothetical protein